MSTVPDHIRTQILLRTRSGALRIHQLGGEYYLPTQAERDILFLRQSGLCAYCLKPLDFSVGRRWNIDHVLAPKRGGSNRIDNLVLACHLCNHRKCSMNYDEFLIADSLYWRCMVDIEWHKINLDRVIRSGVAYTVDQECGRIYVHISE